MVDIGLRPRFCSLHVSHRFILRYLTVLWLLYSMMVTECVQSGTPLHFNNFATTLATKLLALWDLTRHQSQSFHHLIVPPVRACSVAAIIWCACIWWLQLSVEVAQLWFQSPILRSHT